MARNKKIVATTPIAQFISNNMGNNTVVAIAEGIGISHSYLSEILSGRKLPAVEMCIRIAEYFKVPRTQIYTLMGWLDSDEQNDFFVQLLEMAKKDPDLNELVNTYSKLQTPEERRQAIRLLKTMLEK